MASALLLGSTGMVGAHLLTTLRSSSSSSSTSPLSNIYTITRRAPPDPSTLPVPLTPYINPDTTTWTPHLTTLTPPPQIIFSALATTRAAAGSFSAQYALEHDLNISLARAAKSSGAKVYVLISGHGADPNAFFAYTKMKGEIEEHVKELGFEHTIILRPGLIAGHREESRFMEGIFRKIAAGLGSVSDALKDPWAQESEVIARAAVRVGLRALRGEVKEKVVVLAQKDIVREGRTEWEGVN